MVDDVERSLGRLSLIGTDEALRKHMEDMRFERDGLHREIVRLEEDRELVQREFALRQVPLFLQCVAGSGSDASAGACVPFRCMRVCVGDERVLCVRCHRRSCRR